MTDDRPTAFRLTAGNPLSTGDFAPTDETLQEMIETVFPLNTDDAVLEWAGVRFGINYKYDISMMCDDLILLIRKINDTASGECVVNWMSSGFPFRWEVKWEAAKLEILAIPHNESNSALSGNEVIHVSIRGFRDEWIPVLEIVRTAAIQAGYEVANLRNGDLLLSLLGVAQRI